MSVIKVENVHKKFRVYYDKGQTFKEKLLFRNRNRHEDRWVLRGIDFEVEKGEAIGLIGENGSGKSTMLKLMTKIMYPDEGKIEIQGRISSLIELGAGFHPDMSGRENIYTNAAIFGLTRKEIDKRLQTIIDFSELQEFIDNPVRTYSSGMYMRLAFAVAINVDADVLLIDEILAVGDANFQSKCFNKLREIKANGTTIVIVSHALGQIEQICERTVWIDQGKVRMIGSPFEVHPCYMQWMGEKAHGQHVMHAPENEGKEPEQAEQAPQEQAPQQENRWGSGEVRITSVQLIGADGTPKDVFSTGEQMQVFLSYTCHKDVQAPVVGIGIFRNDGVNCYGTNTLIDQIPHVELQPEGYICCMIDANNLLEGEYTLDVSIHAEDGFAYDYFKRAVQFRMYSEIRDTGIMRMPHRWKID